MFEPLLGFTNTNCTGRTNTLFLHEKPQFVSVKGTTKKADAFGLFVYPNSLSTAARATPNAEPLDAHFHYRTAVLH